MRTRHKPPALVSMWMLDVFCCALGCVTLLWLLNNRTATDQTARAASALADLSVARSALSAVSDDLSQTKTRLTADIDELKAKLLATTAEREAAEKQLAVARTDVASLETKLAKATADSLIVQEELRKKQRNADEQATKLAAASQSAADLSQLLRKKDDELLAATTRLKAADEKLKELDARLAAADKSTADMASARTRADDLQRKLDTSAATIIDLQGDKKKLADKFDQLRVTTDAKFAGIATTGKRVVLVVDTSGSMNESAYRVPAPTKWPTVVETIGKIMRSIPDLEKVQVVTFSREAQYLFGTSTWIDYLGEPTVTKITTALLAIDPKMDTNLYAALDLAFLKKADGLDTVYVFSDGLPTVGTGLTEDQKKLTEPQQTEILSKHIRQTLTRTWNPPGAKRVKINAIGFFYESPEVGAFLWSLARENDGSFVGMSRP